ncbi:tyrosine-type recombinase/integrase [Halobellus sp. EA9]|uniref:tyrosine-type recombinase/integrase n=1 Tax=Halobellus sp. EA9 TaxID=3421647 RepID=UPI003EBD3F26
MPANDRLEPMAVAEAKRLYLKDRRDEVAEKTVKSQRLVLTQFAEWCEDEGIEDMNDLTGRDLHRHRLWMKDRNLANATIRNRLSTLRVFIKWAGTVEAVPKDLHEKIDPPTLTDDDRRERMLSAEMAEDALEYLDTYEYASRRHATLKLLWKTGLRMGAARSIDLEDLHLDDQYIDLQHRPSSETPLKNTEASERAVALDDETTTVLGEYVEVRRIDVVDEYGRRPLFTTENGRVAKTTIRRDVCASTRPCLWGPCPHDRDPADCAAANDPERSYDCPSSVTPHPVRRGSLTHHLLNDVPEQVVSDRMDVSQEVLGEHYDERTRTQQMEQRREYLDNI